MYQLTIDHLGERHTTEHRDYQDAHRALVAFAVVADCYLHEQPTRELPRCYQLMLPMRSPSRPRTAGQARIEPAETS
jgi:hypothetical protein